MGRKARLKREDREKRAREERARYADLGRGYRSLSLKERSLITIEAIGGIFELDKTKNVSDIKRFVTPDRIRKFYQFIAALWSPSTDWLSLLPKPDIGLRALYLGDTRPDRIAQSILRYSLYADQILACHPFHNPWQMSPEFNPITRPEIHIDDTLKLIFFYAGLGPWIDADLVVFIPNPCHFDRGFFHETKRRAQARYNKHRELMQSSDEMKELTQEMGREVMLRAMLAMPKERLLPHIKATGPSEMTDEEHKMVLAYIESQRSNPLMPDNDVTSRTQEQLFAFRGGANLETALFLSHVTGAYPYTAEGIRWKEILTSIDQLSADARVWSPLTAAFQQLDFRFLNNLDLQFACRMREEERLSGFRNLLRRIWNSVGGAEATDAKMEHLARAYRDELQEEYQKAQAEWDGITDELKRWGVVEATGAMMGVGAAVATGSIVPWLATAGVTVAGVGHLLSAWAKHRRFRKTVPMSVFVDLKRRGT